MSTWLVVQDIDCSLQFAGSKKPEKPKKKKKKTKHDLIFTISSNDDESYELESASGKSEVTLSGLLNLIDSLWLVIQGERIIIFTTNCVDMLDPALIRRGRMDVHVEMSYCRIEDLKIDQVEQAGHCDQGLPRGRLELVGLVVFAAAGEDQVVLRLLLLLLRLFRLFCAGELKGAVDVLHHQPRRHAQSGEAGWTSMWRCPTVGLRV